MRSFHLTPLACAVNVQGGPKIPDHFLKFIASVYDDVERRSIQQNVQFFIGTAIVILNVATVTYSSHKFIETILH